jgi:hypothetical protein
MHSSAVCQRQRRLAHATDTVHDKLRHDPGYQDWLRSRRSRSKDEQVTGPFDILHDQNDAFWAKMTQFGYK